MNLIKVKIINSVNEYDKKFTPLLGREYKAFDQVDNNGDICLIDAPFVFIPSFMCKEIKR